ncbi:MAG: 1-acyl-sn-glycerol-3-phosphate acyltransferase, partial [Planctomycetaceae bacterium]|nr:1-acyl-sn-glycerol-3-phosphate acyltransferase [Planctomycetaceae bacterium]
MPERSWLVRLWYEFLHFLLRMLGVAWIDFRVDGREHVPRTGGGILLCNHQSFYDPILVGMATDRYIRQVARKSLFRSRFFRWFIAPMGGIALDREGGGTAGLKETIGRLKNGELVVLFPEGVRSPDGELQPLKPGFSILAKRGKAPIIPVAVEGPFVAWPRHQKLPGLAPMHVEFGEPLAFDEIESLDEPALIAELERRMQACLDAV